MTVLFVVPARGGSKGLKNKNLRLVHGRSLTWWAIDFCSRVSRKLSGSVVCISSDSSTILGQARGFAGVIPILRPDALSDDTASDQGVLLHALAEVEKSQSCTFDFIVMVQPTAPGRSQEEFEKALDSHIARRKGATATWSVSLVPDKFRSEKLIKHLIDGDGFDLQRQRPAPPRRQDLRPEYYRNGDFYILDRASLKDPYLVGKALDCWISVEATVNIDDLDELKHARKVCFVQDGSLKRVKGAI